MPPSSKPRISILVPNFNNGRESSRDGRTDLIGDLLQSIHQTLADDPTPWELLVCDDGSNDDSLQTLRDWTQRRRSDGQPFLTLIEGAHTGRLSINANRLCRLAQGEILVRLDGDVVILTPRWAEILCRYFDQGTKDLGIVGPKQLRPDGRIHAMGDFLLHPNGYTHLANGLPRNSVNHAVEVDHIMGCFYCCRREVYRSVGGYDEEAYRSETEDFGVAARVKGWRAIAVPDIEFIHRHTMRKNRESVYDDPQCVEYDLKRFERKWGFSRLAPDLDQVARRYAQTPLLWNRRVFPPLRIHGPQIDGPGQQPFEQTAWFRYMHENDFQQTIHCRMNSILDMMKRVPQVRIRHAALVGPQADLLAHLLAMQGLKCAALMNWIDLAHLADHLTSRHSYPVARPQYLHLGSEKHWPLAPASQDMVLLVDAMEHHPNPVRLLRQADRVLKPGGLAIITSHRPVLPTPSADRVLVDPTDPAIQDQPWDIHPYQWPQLLNQVVATVDWDLMFDPQPMDGTNDLVLAATRPARSGATLKLVGAVA